MYTDCLPFDFNLDTPFSNSIKKALNVSYLIPTHIFHPILSGRSRNVDGQNRICFVSMVLVLFWFVQQ